MASYSVELTQTEDLAMQYIAASVDEWIQNAVHERARVAIDEIVRIAVERFLQAGQPIPGSKDEIVAAAYANGWVRTGADRMSDLQAPSIPVQA